MFLDLKNLANFDGAQLEKVTRATREKRPLHDLKFCLRYYVDSDSNNSFHINYYFFLIFNNFKRTFSEKLKEGSFVKENTSEIKKIFLMLQTQIE